VLLNIAVWDKHSSLVGTLFLFIVRGNPPAARFAKRTMP
jgi:hypothetical protein